MMRSGERLVYEAVIIRKADKARGEYYLNSEDAAIAALIKFGKSPPEILRLKDRLAKAVAYVLEETIDQQG